jgi:hypothetical protein
MHFAMTIAAEPFHTGPTLSLVDILFEFSAQKRDMHVEFGGGWDIQVRGRWQGLVHMQVEGLVQVQLQVQHHRRQPQRQQQQQKQQ